MTDQDLTRLEQALGPTRTGPPSQERTVTPAPEEPPVSVSDQA
jgi:hypothetical protein